MRKDRRTEPHTSPLPNEGWNPFWNPRPIFQSPPSQGCGSDSTCRSTIVTGSIEVQVTDGTGCFYE